jgi:hypothetical protein
MVLFPPSEGTEYLTRADLIAAVQEHVRSEGYTITIRNSNSHYKITHLGCDRGGTYRQRNGINPQTCHRYTASRLTGCPFSVRASEKDGNWILKVRNPDHNYDITNAAAHPI